MSDFQNEVWITGIGLVSSLGEGPDAHWRALTAEKPTAITDDVSFAPYSIHPMCALDYSSQIPKRGDLRQMEDWQRIGTYAAGLALEDAGIKGNTELLDQIHIIAAAGNGERDPQADTTVLEAIKGDPKWQERLNDLLLTNLRPTLYLAQQTQLLAGNISIVHKVTGGSRTYKGEEIAGVQIIQNAVERIEAGQGELFLIGAAYNAARWDQLLALELNERLDAHGANPGSMGAFLIVESKKHASDRGATPYARIKKVQAEMMPIGEPEMPVGEMRLERDEAQSGDVSRNLRAISGHGGEAQFPLELALAALALSKGGFFSSFDSDEQAFEGDCSAISLTCQSGRGGRGTALVEKVCI